VTDEQATTNLGDCPCGHDELLTRRELAVLLMRQEPAFRFWQARAEADPWDDTSDWNYRHLAARVGLLRARLECAK
jgi:hypothetical protein